MSLICASSGATRLSMKFSPRESSCDRSGDARMSQRGRRFGGGGGASQQPGRSPAELALARGREHHQAGRFAEAEAIYRQVLAADPVNASAMHLLGVLANQLGHPQASI